MSKESEATQAKSFVGIQCFACGNKELFVEIMSYEAHLVDRYLTYKRLLVGEIDRYECYLCGEAIDFDPYTGRWGNTE